MLREQRRAEEQAGGEEEPFSLSHARREVYT